MHTDIGDEEKTEEEGDDDEYFPPCGGRWGHGKVDTEGVVVEVKSK